MYRKKLDEDMRCPLEYGMNLMSGKWKTRILCMLGHTGPMRFGEIKTELVNITDGVLASTLNEMIATELVDKSCILDQSAAEYKLTEKGRSIIPIMRALCRWSDSYYDQDEDLLMEHCRQCEFYRRRRYKREKIDQ